MFLSDKPSDELPVPPYDNSLADTLDFIRCPVAREPPTTPCPS